VATEYQLRGVIEEALHFFARWLLECPDVWADDKTKLHQMNDHFDGQWEPAHSDPVRKPKVLVTKRKDARKIQAKLGYERLFDINEEVLRRKRRGWALRNKPSAKDVVTYSRRVLLMLSSLEDRGLLPNDLRDRIEKFENDVDAASTFLGLGGRVA
jgi:hypothetical protein